MYMISGLLMMTFLTNGIQALQNQYKSVNRFRNYVEK